MKFKKILIIICIFLLTGCSANYEITIKNNKITENLKLVENNPTLFDKKLESGSTIRELFESIVNYKDPFAEPKYNIKEINTSDTLGIEYNSAKKNDEIEVLGGLNTCYSNPKIEIENGIVTVETGKDFKCYEYYELLDNVRVVINTNHKVIDSNADEKKGNSYIWNITKDGNKNIKFSYKEKINTDGKMTIVLVLIVIVIIISVLYVINKRNKANNKI